MGIHIDVNDVIKLLVAVIAAAVVVTKLIDGLQKTGAVKDGQAHNWNQVLAFVVALAGFLLKQFGAGDAALIDAQSFGLQIAAALVTGFTIAIAAKALHEVVKWLEGHSKRLGSVG